MDVRHLSQTIRDGVEREREEEEKNSRRKTKKEESSEKGVEEKDGMRELMNSFESRLTGNLEKGMKEMEKTWENRWKETKRDNEELGYQVRRQQQVFFTQPVPVHQVPPTPTRVTPGMDKDLETIMKTVNEMVAKKAYDINVLHPA